MSVQVLRQVLFLAAGAGMLLASTAVPARAEQASFAAPPVETWAKCGHLSYPLAIRLEACLDPNGDGTEYGVIAWSDDASPVYLGKAWGIRYSEDLVTSLERMRVLLRLDDGSEFLGAEGVEPDVQESKDASGNVTIAIRLLGEDGTIAERRIVLSGR